MQRGCANSSLKLPGVRRILHNETAEKRQKNRFILINALQSRHPDECSCPLAEAAEGGGVIDRVQFHHERAYRKLAGTVHLAAVVGQQEVVQDCECKAGLLALVWYVAMVPQHTGPVPYQGVVTTISAVFGAVITLVSCPDHTPRGERRSGERSRISWA